jgi:hypothetical protein
MLGTKSSKATSFNEAMNTDFPEPVFSYKLLIVMSLIVESGSQPLPFCLGLICCVSWWTPKTEQA